MGKTGRNPGLRFGPQELREARQLIRLALAEDLPHGDITTQALVPPRTHIRALFVPRERGVVCGLPVVVELLRRIDRRIASTPLHRDGDMVKAGDPILEIAGPAQSILEGERTALNFIQRLSGIATTTRAWKSTLRGFRALLLDTRKTIPGWRYLEKYAVRAGGGTNHRFNLSDQALVKDNHLHILRALGAGGHREWVSAIRKKCPGVEVEVEVESLDEFREAVAAGADIILLDNMTPSQMAQAARMTARLRKGARPLLEASGGIDARSLRKVARTGVDRISAGSLTHSALALDIGLDLLEVYCEGDGN